MAIFGILRIDLLTNVCICPLIYRVRLMCRISHFTEGAFNREFSLLYLPEKNVPSEGNFFLLEN